MIAALFVDPRGVYSGRADVDVWGVDRDARGYGGPHPVVAHPPCSRWCQLAFLNQKRWGRKVGDDGGCFAAALEAVRRYGGVLEHPARSYAWPAFGLAKPPLMGWSRGLEGDWVCEVSQRAYGHPARKLTWLYYVGEAAPPSLDWSRPAPIAQCGKCANHGDSPLRRLHQREAAATPPAFATVLLGMARASRERAVAA